LIISQVRELLIFNVVRKKYNVTGMNQSLLFINTPKLLSGNEEINDTIIDFDKSITLNNSKIYYLRSIVCLNLKTAEVFNQPSKFITGCSTFILPHPHLGEDDALYYNPYSITRENINLVYNDPISKINYDTFDNTTASVKNIACQYGTIFIYQDIDFKFM